MVVTIITVVKNDVQNIEKTINSVFSQTYEQVEHIVIDGSSTDGTLDIIKKNKKKVSVIYSGKDKNLYQALNKGIKMSNGEVIGILHSGDIYASKNSIKKSLDFIKKKRVDIVISNLKVINIKKKVYRYVTTSNFFQPCMLSMGIQPPHPTLFIKKKVVEKLKYYSTDYKVVGDFDFFCKIFKKKKYKWGNLRQTTILQSRGGLSDGNITDKIAMSRDMSKILDRNNYFFYRIFFIFKLLVRIKETIFKK
tara:strand:- start:434 stop:1183 length:750 start_codon:yes stop_codon:yes gene_type:complete